MSEQSHEADAVSVDPTDPYEREGQTFPKLSADQATRVAAYGKKETLADGTVVFARGERSVDFFVVLDGSIEINF